MATAINKSWLIDGLLVDIGDTLSEAKFTELVNLYNDVPIPDSITDQFRVLKHLKEKEKLELEELAKNLKDIGCEDQSQKVRDAIDFIATTNCIQPEDDSSDSSGNRKKGQHISYNVSSTLHIAVCVGTNDQDDPLTDGDEVDEIPRQEPDDNDKKYMQEAIDLWEKSEDNSTKVSYACTCMYPKVCNILYRLEAYCFTLNME